MMISIEGSAKTPATKALFLLSIICMLATASAHANYIGSTLNFNDGDIQGGTISFDGETLMGSSINIATITGVGTDHDGTIGCNDCLLDFSSDSGNGEGGFLTITGSIDMNGDLNGITPAFEPSAPTLVSGMFTSLLLIEENGHLTVFGSGIDTKDEYLVGHFFDSPIVDWQFGLTITAVSSPTFTSGFSVAVADVNFRNVPVPASVPEPGTLTLLSLGLAGLGFARRRMKA
jgi:hypothetical protein